MKDIYFSDVIHVTSVVPGFYIIIYIAQANRMPSPYGECVDDAEPLSTCMTKCTSKLVLDECGCIDLYMADKLFGMIVQLACSVYGPLNTGNWGV